MTLPIPRLVTFYNGMDDVTDRILKLSDSFPKGKDIEKPDVEVTVHMYNIRPLCRSNILDGCKPLIEYSWFIEKVRENRKSMEMMEAVDKAIEVMPEDYGLRGFLKQHQSEVKNMCITEYNEAETMQLFKKEGREEQLIIQVCRKLRKGKSVEQIADALEEDEEYIQKICDAAETYAPDYDEEKVIQAVWNVPMKAV